MNYRVKILLFIICTLITLFIFDTAHSALRTLSQLDAVEAARDRWQRPYDVIRVLDLQPGNTVVDLGCGSGYFTLRLSAFVGDNGRVIAEDIRRLPLAFLWLRTWQKEKHNVTIVRGEDADPHLPDKQVNAVLIVNTYHEFVDPRPILDQVWQSLIPGGRLVVADRQPSVGMSGIAETAAHEIAAAQVERQLHDAHFEIVSRQDRFIERDPDNEAWWLIVADKR